MWSSKDEGEGDSVKEAGVVKPSSQNLSLRNVLKNRHAPDKEVCSFR